MLPTIMAGFTYKQNMHCLQPVKCPIYKSSNNE